MKHIYVWSFINKCQFEMLLPIWRFVAYSIFREQWSADEIWLQWNLKSKGCLFLVINLPIFHECKFMFVTRIIITALHIVERITDGFHLVDRFHACLKLLLHKYTDIQRKRHFMNHFHNIETGYSCMGVSHVWCDKSFFTKEKTCAYAYSNQWRIQGGAESAAAPPSFGRF